MVFRKYTEACKFCNWHLWPFFHYFPSYAKNKKGRNDKMDLICIVAKSYGLAVRLTDLVGFSRFLRSKVSHKVSQRIKFFLKKNDKIVQICNTMDYKSMVIHTF